MSRILRITLMWLLALAVPVQGFAAASMIGCGTGHHGVTAQADHRHHASGAGHSDVHKSHAGAKFSKASCSACASCCTSAAPPSTPVIFEATDAPDAFLALAPQPVASFVSGGPERPPRSVLA